MQPLSGLDASFLYAETPSQHSHVVGTLLLDTTDSDFSFERLEQTMTDRLHLLPPMRRRLAWVPLDLGHPVWFEDPDFDLEQHIHRVAVRAPGTLHELAEVVGDIASRPLDRSRPLWELHVVEGLADNLVGFVTKIHHAAIDGVSGADLIAHLFDLAPDATGPERPESAWEPESEPSDLDLMSNAVRKLATRPATLVKVMAKTVRSAVDVVQQRRQAASDDQPQAALPFTAPRTKFTGAITPHRSVAFGRAQLEDLKFVKSVFGTTVNDVVLAATTESLRRWLLAHDDLPDAPLICSVPVSVRGQTEQEGANQVSSMFVRLPVQIEDPVEQLRTINADTKQAKEMQKAIGADMLQDFAQFIPPTLFNRAMRLYSSLNLADRHRPIQNLIVSNVPGPPIPLYVAGARVAGIYPFGPLIEGSGINITVLSNMGQVDFGIIACREMVPDQWSIAEGFGAAVAELKQAAEKAAAEENVPDA